MNWMTEYNMRYFVVIVIVILAVSILIVFSDVQANARDQIVVDDYRLEFNFVQGNFGEWYAYCIDGCERLLDVASVNEVHQSFSNPVDAMNHSLILTGRVYGFTPDLFPNP